MLKGHQTERLEFRELNESHIPDMMRFWNDPVATKFYGEIESPEKKVALWLEGNKKRIEKYGRSFYALHLKANGKYVGQVGLLDQKFDGEDELHLEIGYQLMPEHWGYGYATEAAKYALDKSFELLEIDQLISIIDPKNTQSAKVAERNGMKIIRTAIFKGFLDNIWAIDRHNWTPQNK